MDLDYLEDERVIGRRADEVEGLEVRVWGRLGPLALAPDDEHREEAGEAEERQHELRVCPRRVRHRRPLQVAAFDPCAQFLQSLQSLELSCRQPAWFLSLRFPGRIRVTEQEQHMGISGHCTEICLLCACTQSV